MRAACVLLSVLLAACGSPGTSPVDSSLDTSSSADAASPADRAVPDAPLDARDEGARDEGAPDAGSGETGPTGAVTVLRVHYPAGARAIHVRGSAGPLNWMAGVAAAAGADDTWTFTSSAITSVTEWKPLLDDTTWSRGPNYRVAPGQTVDVYPHFTATAGRVYQLFPAFRSALLNNTRVVWAYVPPTYVENSRASFPVVYMHDGQNLFDRARAFGGNEWRVDEAIDTAAEDGSIAEAVVVAPEASPGRIYEYTPTRDDSIRDGGGGDLYLRMLVEELKPQVDAMLRVRRDPGGTAIMGSSLGGLISAYAGLRRAATFGLVGAMSPSTWWDNEVIIADVTMSAGMTPRASRVYLDSGDSGPSNDDVTQTTNLAREYVRVGYAEGRDLLHVVQPGAQHSEVYWAQRFPGALRFLLGPRALLP